MIGGTSKDLCIEVCIRRGVTAILPSFSKAMIVDIGTNQAEIQFNTTMMTFVTPNDMIDKCLRLGVMMSISNWIIKRQQSSEETWMEDEAQHRIHGQPQPSGTLQIYGSATQSSSSCPIRLQYGVIQIGENGEARTLCTSNALLRSVQLHRHDAPDSRELPIGVIRNETEVELSDPQSALPETAVPPTVPSSTTRSVANVESSSSPTSAPPTTSVTSDAASSSAPGPMRRAGRRAARHQPMSQQPAPPAIKAVKFSDAVQMREFEIPAHRQFSLINVFTDEPSRPDAVLQELSDSGIVPQHIVWQTMFHSVKDVQQRSARYFNFGLLSEQDMIKVNNIVEMEKWHQRFKITALKTSGHFFSIVMSEQKLMRAMLLAMLYDDCDVEVPPLRDVLQRDDLVRTVLNNKEMMESFESELFNRGKEVLARLRRWILEGISLFH